MTMKGFICDAHIRHANGEDVYAYEPTDLIVLWDRDIGVISLKIVSRDIELEFTQYEAFTFREALDNAIEASGEAGQ